MDLLEYSATTQQVRHPWERARATLITHLVTSLLPRDRAPVRILDVGSGDGWLARELARTLHGRAQVTCYDANYTPELLAHLGSSNPSTVTYTKEEPSTQADLVLALDVMEHVEDDRSFGRSLAGHLAPGGHLIVTVPADPALFGPHDVALGHFRRYRLQTLVEVLEASDLQIEQSGHLFSSLFLVRRLQARFTRPRRTTSEDLTTEYLHWNGPAWLAGLISAGLVAEGRLTLGLRALGPDLPGLSCWAVANAP